VNAPNNKQHKLTGLSRQYQAALRKHLTQAPRSGLQAAQALGRTALNLKLDTLMLARLHEKALIKVISPADSAAAREGTIRRAGKFFAEAITPIESIHRAARDSSVRLDQVNQMLRRRSEDLAASNQQLKVEIAQRKVAEEALKNSEHHYCELLQKSQRMQEHLRLLSRQLLSAQEEERRKISRELHDVIAQTLTSINVRLAKLKKEAGLSTKGLERSIGRTQRLVEHSVNIVHQFARELRPTVLDDLGLIPALHTFMKSFRAETGIGVSLSAPSNAGGINGERRIVLYRVAQEALTNVARHAQASHAEVRIRKLNGTVSMTIRDNGKGFHEEHRLQASKTKRLGLLGMRERLDMVGGKFTITSAPGKGTTVLAEIPLTDRKVLSGGGGRRFSNEAR
jgi:signal transduction histidine kinase